MQDETIKSPNPDSGSALPVTPDPAFVPLPATPQLEPHPDGPVDVPAATPAWAEDLRKLYQAVVAEPLPDSLLALLAQLDAED